MLCVIAVCDAVTDRLACAIRFFMMFCAAVTLRVRGWILRMAKEVSLLAKIGVDTAKNKPRNGFKKGTI